MHSQTGFLLVLFGLLNITPFLVAFSLDNIIMTTKVNCSSFTDTGFGKVSIVSDAQLKVVMYCNNSNFTYKMEPNKVSLDIPLAVSSTQFCQVTYLQQKKTYEAFMSVYRILGKREEIYNSYRLICDEENFTIARVSIKVNNPYQNPEVIEHFYNKEMYVNLDLEVRNINGVKLDILHIYRKVQLYANSPKSFAGIQARECKLKVKEEYTILKAGCGTGCIFTKNQGFITKGTLVTSSYFLLPPIISKTAIFSCKFRVCTTNCDGNSCNNNNKNTITIK